MLKRTYILVAGVVAVLAVSLLFVMNRETNISKPVAEMVAEKGPPTFLANSLEIDKTDLRVLRVTVLPQDPKAVTNWGIYTNVMLVWAESEPSRRNARYFYEEMKNEKSFDGSAWYSRRSLFRRDKVTIINTDATGNASREQTFRIDAISMHLMDFVPRKPSVNDRK
jgi:hypothetical protein